MSIKNIVFDVGKVLVSFEPDAFMSNLGFTEDEKKAVNQAMFENPLWLEADRGTYEKDEYLQLYINENPAYEAAIRKAYEKLGDTVELFPYVVEWMQSLKKRGYHLYVLSNYSEYLLEQTRDKMLFLPYMDGVVFSAFCKKVKPNAAIYEHLMNTYGLISDECVFIDDRPDNVEGALNCGMHAIVFTDYEQTCQELDMLLQQSIK